MDKTIEHLKVYGGYSAIDIFKLIAAILVVGIHTHPFHNDKMSDYIFTCLCRIAVPFFFVFSSFIFYKKDKPDIKKYVIRLLKMYAFWFIAELPFIYERFFVNSHYCFMVNFCLFTKNLLLQNTFYASWYLTALCEGMMIVYWMVSRKRESALRFLSLLCIVFALLGSMYSPFIKQLDCYKYLKYLFILFTPSNSFVVAIPYCYFGMKLAQNHSRLIKIRCKWLILFTLLSLWIAEIRYSLTFKNYELTTDAMVSLFAIAPVLVLYLTSCSFSLSVELQRFFRHSSILIYLSHSLISHILTSYFGYSSGINLFLLTLLLSILIAILLITLSQHIKLFRYAF